MAKKDLEVQGGDVARKIIFDNPPYSVYVGFLFACPAYVIISSMIKKILENKVRRAVGALYSEVDTSGMNVERSGGFGDYASNVAMVLAGTLGRNPREVAGEVKEEILSKATGQYIKSAEIAGPGFLNITLTEEAILSELGVMKDSLISGFDFISGEKINIEFISANPTGALHIGHGRGAFYGDVLSNILSFAGADVVREYYINDSRESNQIKELGKTALGVGEQYKTVQLEKMIEEMDFAGFDESEVGFALGKKVQEYNRNFIENKLGIKFGNWYSEDENIRAAGVSDKIIEELDKKDLIYKRDGAVWIKTSEYGNGEDMVVVRSDGTKSYFVSDIAYHKDKFERGYDKVIDVWGADHHGHVKRMHAVGKMLGWPMEPQPQPIIFITQLVSLKEGGERKRMSKRAGTAIPFEELVDDFGIDVVRWFFSDKSLGTHMDFDAQLAKEQSQKNPVYYVQYAHARICSILEKTKELKADKKSLADALKTEKGRALAMKITEFEEVVEDIAGDFGVHKITTYAHELASEFSGFYNDVRIVEDDTYNSGALELALIAKNTLAKTLSLLGVSAPEKM